MIPVYGSLITILSCTFFPPAIDRLQKKDENWRWSRSVIGYGVMTVTMLVLPVIIGGSRYIDLLFIIPAIAVAALIVPITYAGTFFVLCLSQVILIIAILWDISRYNVKEPLNFVFSTIEWHIFIMPMILGFITLFTVRYVTAKLRHS